MERRNPGDLTDRLGIVPGSSPTSLAESESNPQTNWSESEIARVLSSARMGTYLKAVNGNLTDALTLYDWNSRANAAVIHTVGMAEVLVRNTLNNQLIEWAANRGERIWLESAPLDAKGTADIREAKRRSRHSGSSDSETDNVVPHLSLGFWRYLVAPRYYSVLWVPTLSYGFIHGHDDIRKRRALVADRLDRLNTVRNRAAHHEPNIRRDLGRDLGAAIDLARWISPDAAIWLSQKSWLPDVLTERESTLTLNSAIGAVAG